MFWLFPWLAFFNLCGGLFSGVESGAGRFVIKDQRNVSDRQGLFTSEAENSKSSLNMYKMNPEQALTKKDNFL